MRITSTLSLHHPRSNTVCVVAKTCIHFSLKCQTTNKHRSTFLRPRASRWPTTAEPHQTISRSTSKPRVVNTLGILIMCEEWPQSLYYSKCSLALALHHTVEPRLSGHQLTGRLLYPARCLIPPHGRVRKSN